MQSPLTKKQVHVWMSLLTENQKIFLEKTIKQSKKSKWLEVLARNKGISINIETTQEELERLVDDWVLIEILDSGFGNRNYRCMCGMPLRYQYLVLNKKEGDTVGLGETCFQNHTNLSTEVVKDILKEFHQIDLVRDEILYKVASTQRFDITPYLGIEEVPSVIIEQARLNLPLTDKQISLLAKLKQAHDTRKRKESILHSLEPSVRNFFDSLSDKIKGELISKMLDGDYYKFLPEGFYDAEIEQYMSLGFPLLDRQINKIFEYNRLIKQEKVIQIKSEEIYFNSFQEQQGKPYLSLQKYETTVDYNTLMERHLSTLKKVRVEEARLSRGLVSDWLKIQEMVRQSKNSQDIDYSSFKLNLTMICYSLNIEMDQFL